MFATSTAPAQPVQQPGLQPVQQPGLQPEFQPPPFPEAQIARALTGETPANPVKVPRNGKLPKIKRNENSFRPGFSAAKLTPATPVKPKELTFYLPASRARGNGDEATRVQNIADQLSTHTDVGTVTAFGIRNQTWEINLTLVQRNAENEDKFLSEVFLALMPTIEALPDLRNGFCVGKSSTWAYKIGAFVADQDSFN